MNKRALIGWICVTTCSLIYQSLSFQGWICILYTNYSFTLVRSFESASRYKLMWLSQEFTYLYKSKPFQLKFTKLKGIFWPWQFADVAWNNKRLFIVSDNGLLKANYRQQYICHDVFIKQDMQHNASQPSILFTWSLICLLLYFFKLCHVANQICY